MPAPTRQCPTSAPPVSGSSAEAAIWGTSQSEPFDLRVRASQIKWDYSPSFDPAPYLSDDRVRGAFRDPDAIRLPLDEWPRGLSVARVHMGRADLWELFRKWDFCGALHLTPSPDPIRDEACGLFRAP